MGYALPLVLGFITASVGVTPPGLINMTAAKVSLNDGRSRAITFALGAIIVVFIQTYIAILFARFINKRPDIVNLLQEVGLTIFLILTIYFFFIAKETKVKEQDLKERSKMGRFFLGMLLSALNFFPIPYYVFISITLSTYNYFYFEKSFIITFVLGVVLGSFTVFYLYIIFFKKIQAKSSFFMSNMNYMIGSVTGLISVITIIKLINNYIQ
ncbi:LysE family transporter [Flavobacterium sp. '19STA2R22 D10 B1']|uniref:LysE family transporter n=1 Tax=Flavobacterium aerium TaxID=3037261 RepID=UPI00278C50D4|nr:LysE family transporter [Flavobacterium sp. '19STA2R22 D10 B1']